jgi:hypothetical protein
MHFDGARHRPGARTRSELADVFLTLAAANAAAGRAESAIWHLLVLFWSVDLLGKLRYVRFPVGCQAGCR